MLVAAGTVWLLFGLGLLLRNLGRRRLMRVADAMLATELVSLIPSGSVDGVAGPPSAMALVVVPSLAAGFAAWCLQQALSAARRAGGR